MSIQTLISKSILLCCHHTTMHYKPQIKRLLTFNKMIKQLFFFELMACCGFKPYIYSLNIYNPNHRWRWCQCYREQNPLKICHKKVRRLLKNEFSAAFLFAFVLINKVFHSSCVRWTDQNLTPDKLEFNPKSFPWHKARPFYFPSAQLVNVCWPTL